MAFTSVGFAKTVATVGGTNIDSSEVDAQVKLIIKNSGGKIKDNKALRNDVLQKLISREVISKESKKLKLDQSKAYTDAVKAAEAEAKKKGITNNPSYQKDFESYKKVLLADIYALDFLKKNQVTDKEAKGNYDKMAKFYKGTQEVKVGEILTKDSSTAQKAISELSKGSSFSSAAKKYTIDPNMKSNGGIYKEYINLKDMQAAVPEYYAVVYNLKKGEFTKKPLKSGNNYLIVGVIDKRAAKIPSFNSVKNSIKTSMAQSKLQKESERLNKVYNVKIY
ncbi:MAG: peptidyl-prolyl cis-trans isomerase, partial [Neisseriaceae bacterium]|nr:peptidyl-prolyl cis-trans isomerase [Neisseriaceae bacterium]